VERKKLSGRLSVKRTVQNEKYLNPPLLIKGHLKKMENRKRFALYARVSKALDQNPENQLIDLRKWASNNGCIVVGEFVDEVSSKDTRPQKEIVLKKIRLGECDGVAFWSLDRWGRTASELILELEEFSKTDKSLIALKEGIDLSTAAGRMMANMLAIMANFERDRIRERTLLGLARARSQGKKLGRPWKKLTPPANPPELNEETTK
jgi:DNA invertase Pin-like site-specific DNA recombinase